MLKGHFTPSVALMKAKQSELNFLRQHFDLDLPAIEDSYESLHLAKLELKNRARAQYFTRCHPLLSTTNLSGEKKHRIAKFLLSYSYQRSGMKLLGRNPFELLYPLAKTNKAVQSWAVLTRSGQTSTYVALSTLKLFLRHFQVTCQESEVYYETKHLLKLHHKTLPSRSAVASVYFIDSSTETLSQSLRPPENPLMAVIDTTCYVHGEKTLDHHLNFFLEKKIPILLLRSHLKLDSLGMEFASLGSICLLLPKCSPEATLRRYRRFYKMLFEMCQIQGGFAGTEQIYPFYHDPFFHQLNGQRWQRIKKNGLLLEKKMRELLRQEGKKPRVHFFGHHFFFWLEFPHRLDPSELRSLGRALSFLGIPYRFAESFGFDFVTISHFPNDRKTSSLRVSAGDLDQECFPLLAQAIFAWASKQMNPRKLR